MWEYCSKFEAYTHTVWTKHTHTRTFVHLFCFFFPVLVLNSDAFDFEYGTVILRVSEGLDVSHIVEAEGQ